MKALVLEKQTCPFSLTRHFGIKIVNFRDFPYFVGLYKSTNRECIWLNESLPPETHEEACHYLLSHALTHKDIDLILTVETLSKLQKADSFSLLDFLMNNKFLSQIINI